MAAASGRAIGMLSLRGLASKGGDHLEVGLAVLARRDAAGIDREPCLREQAADEGRPEAGVEVAIAAGDVRVLVGVQRNERETAAATQDACGLGHQTRRLTS